MAGKQVLEIDGARFETLEGFYEEVSEALIPGSDWGRNLDAFNDILRGGFGTPEGGFRLLWRNHEASRQRLGYPETVRQLKRRLEKCHPENRAHVSERLASAERGTGETVFDWLVDVIERHDEIELVLA